MYNHSCVKWSKSTDATFSYIAKGHENKHLGRSFVKYWKEGKVALPLNGKHRLQKTDMVRRECLPTVHWTIGSFLTRNWVYNGASIGRTM